MDYTKIILAIITGIVALGVGITINSKRKSRKSNQENINITGNDNKVIGGDDNSNK
jgi:hypothetical protein